jgi:hypothetical protein
MEIVILFFKRIFSLLSSYFKLDIMKTKCEFKSEPWDDKIIYYCEVSSISITEPNKTIKPFPGIHAAGKTNEDVEGICFRNTKVEYFPRGLHLFFPHLNSLVISNCGLK